MESKVTFTSRDGLTLVANRRGDPADPNVVFLHGGGQTRHSWGGTAAAVAAAGWCAWTVDSRGHGESDWSPSGDYRLGSFAADVGVIVEEIGGRPALIGASLGGLTSLLLLGRDSPGVASGLVLVDVVPNMEKKGRRVSPALRKPPNRLRPTTITGSGRRHLTACERTSVSETDAGIGTGTPTSFPHDPTVARPRSTIRIC